MKYSELAILIKQHFSNIEDDYDRQIIKDYILVISSLGDLFEGAYVYPDDKFNFYSAELDNVYHGLNGLRMGDVYQKLKYQMFANKICDDLRAKFPLRKIFITDRSNAEDREIDCIYIANGMLRAQGFAEAAYVLKKGLFLTVQIQSNHYKIMIQGYAGYGKQTKDVAIYLKEQNLWFNFSGIGQDLKEYPPQKDFNKYGATDFYRSVRLEPKLTVREVSNFIASNFEMIDNIRMRKMGSGLDL